MHSPFADLSDPEEEQLTDITVLFNKRSQTQLGGQKLWPNSGSVNYRVTAQGISTEELSRNFNGGLVTADGDWCLDSVASDSSDELSDACGTKANSC